MITVEEFEHLLADGTRGICVSEDGYTTRELMETTGKTAAWVRTAMRLAVTAGTWETVRVMRMNLAGIQQQVVAYRPIPKKK